MSVHHCRSSRTACERELCTVAPLTASLIEASATLSGIQDKVAPKISDSASGALIRFQTGLCTHAFARHRVLCAPDGFPARFGFVGLSDFFQISAVEKG
jgi:hypothetical protein